MKSSATAAAFLAFFVPAMAITSGWRVIEAVNIATGESIGELWAEANDLEYPDPVYGDARYDFMFRKRATNSKLVEVSDEPAGAAMRCARESPSQCSGTAYIEVGGGDWEAGHYLVRGGFRYEDAPNYKRDEFFVENYNNATGKADFKYAGTNKHNEDYAFYACGDIPVTEDDEPNGDLFIKYASEPTPEECQDVILQAQFQASTGSMDFTKSYGCMVFNHGIC